MSRDMPVEPLPVPVNVATARRAWDAMMEHYLPDRAALLRAAYDEAERVLGRLPTTVLDLGGGPGTTVEAMLRRWPVTRATLLDVDPVLLTLARRALPASVTTRSADLGEPGWAATLGGRHDVVLAVMTLHYFPASRVRQLYAEIRDLLAPGGVLLVVERLPARTPVPADEPRGDDPWTHWWAELARDPALRPALEERAAIMPRLGSAEFSAPLEWHRDAAHAAGYTGARVACRRGDRALLALTP